MELSITILKWKLSYSISCWGRFKNTCT